MSDTQLPPRTHNNPPIILPKDKEVLIDLQTRYPEIDKRLAEWDAAFATFPMKLTLKDEDIAGNLQDLLGQVKKEAKVWVDSFEKNEKSPLNKWIKIVKNYFTGRFERAMTQHEKYKLIYDDFSAQRDEAARLKAEEEAERQQKIEEDNRARAEAAERERQEAEARAAEERRKEQEAREAAERAKKEREEAEARAEAARAEERRLADEKRERDKIERDKNTAALREVRRLMKEAEKLHQRAEVEGDDADEAELKELDAMVRAGGTIGDIAALVVHSSLLDDEQKAEIEAVRTRLGELRAATNARYDAKERKRREKERKEADAREAVLAEQRRKEQAEHDARLAEATRKRQGEEAAAATAKAEKMKAEAAARTARGAAREADSDVKGAAKDIRIFSHEADRAGNRAARVERRLEDSNIADPLRGDLGTTGSRTKSWKHYITDENALKEVIRDALRRDKALAAYAELFNYMETTAFSDVLNGAVFRYMQAHQGEWHNRNRVDDALAGCLFACEDGSRIA